MSDLAYVEQVKAIQDLGLHTGRLYLRAAEIADPTPDPACLRWRHIWGRSVSGSPGMQVRFCLRCVKRGAYVALTEPVNGAA